MFKEIDKDTIEIETQTPLGAARIRIVRGKEEIYVELFHILINKKFTVNKLDTIEKIGHLIKWITME